MIFFYAWNLIFWMPYLLLKIFYFFCIPCEIRPHPIYNLIVYYTMIGRASMENRSLMHRNRTLFMRKIRVEVGIFGLCFCWDYNILFMLNWIWFRNYHWGRNLCLDNYSRMFFRTLALLWRNISWYYNIAPWCRLLLVRSGSITTWHLVFVIEIIAINCIQFCILLNFLHFLMSLCF